MFATALKEVTGLFDRRALVSSFLPALAFWSLALATILGTELGWSDAVKAWEPLTATVKGILILTFLVLVAFWALLSSIAGAAIQRIFEGHWPRAPWAPRLEAARRRHWQAEMEKREQPDLAFQALEAKLAAERDAWKRFDPQAAAGADAALPQRPEVQALIARNGRREPKREDVESLCADSRQVRDWARSAVQAGDDDMVEAITSAMQVVRDRLDSLAREVRAERTRIHRGLAVAFPHRPSDAAATRLGNVMASAETYGESRYELDTGIVWPRLQSALTAEELDSIQGSKASLDLAVTLSWSALFFGLPLSVWAALHAEDPLPYGYPIALLAVTAANRLGAAAPFAALATGLALAMRLGWIDPSELWVTIAYAAFLAGIALGLAHLAYRIAVHAAVAYAERLRATFDLHRWRVLQAMHLELPESLEEERRLWLEVCQHIDRGYPPSPEAYRLVPPPEPVAELPAAPAAAVPQASEP